MAALVDGLSLGVPEVRHWESWDMGIHLQLLYLGKNRFHTAFGTNHLYQFWFVDTFLYQFWYERKKLYTVDREIFAVKNFSPVA